MNNLNVISGIENQLFNVVELPLTPISNDAKYENPTVRGLYKDQGGKPLGVVGANFNVTQPKALFDAFIECFGEIKTLDIGTLKYQETKGGSKIRYRVQVADYGFKNAVGKTDDVKTYVTLTTGYDGLTKTSLALECFRIICTNGMRVLGTSKTLSVKNVKGNAGKIESICSDLHKVVSKTGEIQEYFKFLNSVNVKEIQVQKVIKATFGYNRKTEDISTARLATLDEIEASIALEIGRTGGNLWGLLNGITHFTNHGGRNKSDRTDYVYQAGGLRINDKAQKAIAELAK